MVTTFTVLNELTNHKDRHYDFFPVWDLFKRTIMIEDNNTPSYYSNISIFRVISEQIHTMLKKF